MNERLFPVKAIAEWASVSEITVRRAIAQGELRAFKVAGRWRVPESAAREWVEREPSGVVVPLWKPRQRSGKGVGFKELMAISKGAKG